MAEPALASGRIAWRGFVLPLALLAAWAVIAHTPWPNPRLLLPLEQILLAPFTSADARNLWPALASSLLRCATGYAIGITAGLALGATLGLSRTAHRIATPGFNAWRQIAIFAWIPLLTAWFGNGDAAKLLFIALSALAPMALNTQRAFATIPATWHEAAAILRLRPTRRFTRVLLPAALPGITTGLELALVTAWLATVTAEYAIGFGQGIGSFLATGRDLFRMDLVLLGTLALALVGYAANHCLRRLTRHLGART